MVLARALSTFSPPPAIIDSHHHYIKPANYLPAEYNAHAGDLNIEATVHIEACGNNGDPVAEVQWLESLVGQGGCKPLSIVALCDLAAPDAADRLKALVAASPRVKGVRWVLDYDGEDSPATHGFVKSNGLPDFLRDPAHAPRFEAGYALLAEHGLSFDLQCAPAQLDAAAALCARHPGVPVVLDHLGKPRALQGDGGAHDDAELATWRAGMAALAALPHAHVKLGMLAFAVPGWVGEPAKDAYLRELVLETVGLFGARRCMFNANWCAPRWCPPRSHRSQRTHAPPTPGSHAPPPSPRRVFAGTWAAPSPTRTPTTTTSRCRTCTRGTTPGWRSSATTSATSSSSAAPSASTASREYGRWRVRPRVRVRIPFWCLTQASPWFTSRSPRVS